MHQRTYDLSIPKTYHDQRCASSQGRIHISLVYIDLNVVIIYLQKRSVEMNPMARYVNRHRQLEEEHLPRIKRTQGSKQTHGCTSKNIEMIHHSPRYTFR